MKSLFIVLSSFQEQEAEVWGVFTSFEKARKALLEELFEGSGMQISQESRNKIEELYGYDIDNNLCVEVGDMYYSIFQKSITE